MTTYDEFAEEYDAKAQTAPHTAQYDRPALLELLGEVDGRTILDAGCGSGLFAEELVRRGAKIVGVDGSANLLALARARLGDGVVLRRHDLTEPLDWIPDKAFDQVLMALVIHYLEDPVPLLRELHRVLNDDGTLAISTHHPSSDWLKLGGSYFADEMYRETWSTGWELTFRRRPLETIVSEFGKAGFRVDRLVEPRPIPEMRESHPETYEQLTRQPGFIAFRLVKREDTTLGT